MVKSFALPGGQPGGGDEIRRERTKFAAQGLRQGFLHFRLRRGTRAKPDILNLHAQIILASRQHARGLARHFLEIAQPRHLPAAASSSSARG